jgi:hypothetical protein
MTPLAELSDALERTAHFPSFIESAQDCAWLELELDGARFFLLHQPGWSEGITAYCEMGTLPPRTAADVMRRAMVLNFASSRAGFEPVYALEEEGGALYATVRLPLAEADPAAMVSGMSRVARQRSAWMADGLLEDAE